MFSVHNEQKCTLCHKTAKKIQFKIQIIKKTMLVEEIFFIIFQLTVFFKENSELFSDL